jgi:hypothetical protein
MSTKNEHHQTVPLSVLLKRELLSEKIENPDIVHGQAGQSKKGEDFTLLKSDCQRMVGDGVYTYSVYGVCLNVSHILFLQIQSLVFLSELDWLHV